MLLAASISAEHAEELREQGVDVKTFERVPSLRKMAAAALAVRNRQPRALLIVAGPARLVKGLERRYPSLVDVALSSASAAAVLGAVADAQRWSVR